MGWRPVMPGHGTPGVRAAEARPRPPSPVCHLHSQPRGEGSGRPAAPTPSPPAPAGLRDRPLPAPHELHFRRRVTSLPQTRTPLPPALANWPLPGLDAALIRAAQAQRANLGIVGDVVLASAGARRSWRAGGGPGRLLWPETVPFWARRSLCQCAVRRRKSARGRWT